MAEREDAIRDDREPVDPYFGRQPPPAMAVDGSLVPNRELEAAAELMRVYKRLNLPSSRVDGFRIYRLYRWLSRAHPARLSSESDRSKADESG